MASISLTVSEISIIQSLSRKFYLASEVNGIVSDKITFSIFSAITLSYLPNQTVNDGVAHSKNPKKCVYHVTFDLDLDPEHTLETRLPGDHRVQVWW